jgi:hypothetical protein
MCFFLSKSETEIAVQEGNLETFKHVFLFAQTASSGPFLLIFKHYRLASSFWEKLYTRSAFVLARVRQ